MAAKDDSCDQCGNKDKTTKQAFTDFLRDRRCINLTRYQKECMIDLINHMSTIFMAVKIGCSIRSPELLASVIFRV